MADDSKVDYYEMLGVAQDATTKEITTAFRKRSLKVHPDRVRYTSLARLIRSAVVLIRLRQNPDNPEAASLFHALREAHGLLSDPARRSQFDTELAARQARAQRFAALDNKRKAMAEDLAEAERAAKRKATEAAQRSNDLARLRDEGRRLREEREARSRVAAADAEAQRLRAAADAKTQDDAKRRHVDGAHDLGPLDTTLRVKWATAKRPALATPEALMSLVSSLASSQGKIEIDSVAIAPKYLADPSKAKKGSALVSFKTLASAVRVMDASTASPKDWTGVEVAWAAGEPPAALGQSQSPPAAASPSPQPVLESAALNEERILAQMRAREREREREKMMEEIRKQDEAGA